ncbi:unnamed protein product, partial [Nesidiocoris tenuis]
MLARHSPAVFSEQRPISPQRRQLRSLNCLFRVEYSCHGFRFRTIINWKPAGNKQKQRGSCRLDTIAYASWFA